MTSLRWRAAAVVTAVLIGLGLAVAPPAIAAAGTDTLWRGETLQTNQLLRSKDGRFRLIMQGDGNLVLYGPNGAAWDSKTSGSGARAIMQGDGHFVVYTGSTATFATGTAGTPSDALVVQNDGNLVIYGGGRAQWDRYSGVLVRPRGWTVGYNQGYAGQCTWYAYDRFKRQTGVYPNLAPADAKDFDNQARARGWKVIDWPAVNSIVVFEPGVGGSSSSFGHVAWVTGISGMNISIMEMNRVRPYEITSRTIRDTSGMSYVLAG
jgi:CHAP domain